MTVDTESLRIADRLKPQPDLVSSEYWSGLQAGVLRLQRCSQCGGAQFYPRAHCSSCGGEVEWFTGTGNGTVHTFTVVRSHHAEPFRSLVPYVVAIIDLEEGPRMLSNIVDCEPEAVFIGMPVRLRIVQDREHCLPFWSPSRERL